MIKEEINMHRAINVKAMDNYLLFIKFDNNEEKIYNCYPLLQDPIFSELSDYNFFQTVHIDNMGVVCWDEATDINPYDLYNQSESLAKFEFAV